MTMQLDLDAVHCIEIIVRTVIVIGSCYSTGLASWIYIYNLRTLGHPTVRECEGELYRFFFKNRGECIGGPGKKPKKLPGP